MIYYGPIHNTKATILKDLRQPYKLQPSCCISISIYQLTIKYNALSTELRANRPIQVSPPFILIQPSKMSLTPVSTQQSTTSSNAFLSSTPPTKSAPQPRKSSRSHSTAAPEQILPNWRGSPAKNMKMMARYPKDRERGERTSG